MTLREPKSFNEAVRAGCNAADIHLTCSFPECKCKSIPRAIQGAIDKWEEQRRDGEQR